MLRLDGVTRLGNQFLKQFGVKADAPTPLLAPHIQAVIPVHDALQGENRLLRGEKLWGTGQPTNVVATNFGAAMVVGNPVGSQVISTLQSIVISVQTPTKPAAAILTASVSQVGSIGAVSPTKMFPADFRVGKGLAVGTVTAWNINILAANAVLTYASLVIDETTNGPALGFADFRFAMPLILSPGCAVNINATWSVALGATAFFNFNVYGYERPMDASEGNADGNIF